jgi:hypothetical protein
MQSRVHLGGHVPAFHHPGTATGFISDFINSAIYEYASNGTQIGTISGGSLACPQGMSTDPSGNLYVANSCDDDTLIYAPPYTGTPTTLTGTGAEPADAAVDSAGNVAVSNFDGTVSCYVGGATSPTSVISGFGEVFFLAFDAAGNIYLDGFDANFNVAVGEIIGGCVSGTTITELTTSNTIAFPGGVQVTQSGLIAIDDQEALAIYNYNPPTGNSLGSPASTTPLSNASDPVTITLAPHNHAVITADAGLDGAQEYRYPAGGTAVKSVTFNNGGLPIGTAIVPTSQFDL